MRLSCPNCGSLLIHRSRKKGIFEYVLSGIIFVHPFRCDECDSRFFRWSLCENPVRPGRCPQASSEFAGYFDFRSSATFRRKQLYI
jgi:hypothetical protein